MSLFIAVCLHVDPSTLKLWTDTKCKRSEKPCVLTYWWHVRVWSQVIKEEKALCASVIFFNKNLYTCWQITLMEFKSSEMNWSAGAPWLVSSINALWSHRRSSRGFTAASQAHLIGAGGLVGAVVVAEVLVGLGRLRFSVDGGVRLVDRRDVVAQGDGLHRFVDAAAHTLAHFGARRLALPGRGGAAGAAVAAAAGGLGGHLTIWWEGEGGKGGGETMQMLSMLRGDSNVLCCLCSL